MPKKKKSSAPQGLSPQQVAQANKAGFDHAMNRLPPITFEDMFSNFGMFSDGLSDLFGGLFGGLIDRGENTIGVADRNPVTATEQLEEVVNPTPTPTPQPTPAQPQLSPYDARIQELMKNRGWSRAQAVENQSSAMQQGGDLNRDGAVTNDEWRQFTRGHQAQPQSFQPQRFQPQVPNMQPQAPGVPPQGPPQVPGVPNLTPEQLAALQNMQVYGRGVV